MKQCKLCLTHVHRLEDSHFLPKGIYKRLRDAKQKNPNPWHITSQHSVQTSVQLKAHLLCQNCEQRFSKFGEKWVLGHCLQQDGSFPLASFLSPKKPDVSSLHTSTKLYYAATFTEIDISALVYFAASVFWRGSIYPWNADGTIPVPLGPFQELLRRYLLGEQAFPQECALWVAVREMQNINRLTYAPTASREGRVHVYRFPMPGLFFLLMVSRNIPVSHRQKCIAHATGNPIFVTSVIESYFLSEGVKLFGESRA